MFHYELLFPPKKQSKLLKLTQPLFPLLAVFKVHCVFSLLPVSARVDAEARAAQDAGVAQVAPGEGASFCVFLFDKSIDALVPSLLR